MSHSHPIEGVGANPNQPDTFTGYLAEVLDSPGLSIRHLDHERGPIYAKQTIRLASAEPHRTDLLLLVTDGDIRVPPLRGLFGYADRRRGIAIVSTARLRDPTDPARTRKRLRNVAAHELGHLKGLNHCAGPRCLMTQVSTPEQLDDRPLTPCPECPGRLARRRQAIGTFAVLLVLVISVIAVERVTSLWEGAAPDFPFL